MVEPSEPYEEFPSIIPNPNPSPQPRPRREPKGTSAMSKKGKKHKKGFLPGIWSAKDGPAPAAWRKSDAPVRGRVRRRDEGKKNTGFLISDRYRDHPKFGEELPPLSEEAAKRRAVRQAIEKLKTVKAAGGEKGGKKKPGGG